MLQRTIALAALCAALSACTSARVADLRDVAQASLHMGLGFSADARLGAITQPAIGLWTTSCGVGNHSRDVWGIFFYKRINPPYAYFHLTDEGRSPLSALNSTGWDGAFQVTGFQRAFEEIDRPLNTKPPRELGREIGGRYYGGELREGAWLPLPDATREAPLAASLVDWTQLEGGAQFGIVGARVGFNPLELLDFLLGFAGVDLAGDDVRAARDGGEQAEQ